MSIPASFSIIILPILIGALGFCSWPRFKENLSVVYDLEESFLSFLAGLAILSTILFFAALFAVFSLPVIAAILLAVIFILRRQAFRPLFLRDTKNLFFCVSAMIGLSMLTTILVKPFDPTLMSSDASVYLAASSHLASSGSLESYDELVDEMTLPERQLFFANRFQQDSTGPYARFPGGVKLIDPATSRVTFHFHHLWVAWLAFGKKISCQSGQYILPFFAAVSFAALFFLGNLFGGRLVGLAVCLVHFFSFPQLYYSRMATSELASQSFFLAGLLLFVKAIQANGTDRQRFVVLQMLSGALWGCFCLSRVDGIIFLFACLFFAFLLIKELRSSLGHWLVLLVTLSLFMALAFIHQLAGVSYQGVLDHFPLVGIVLRALGEFTLHREMLLEVGLIGFALAIFGGVKIHRQKEASFASKIFGGFVLVGFTFLWILFFGGKVSGPQISQQFNWLLLYLPMWLWALFGAGVLSFAFLLRKDNQKKTVFMVLLIFCLVPGLSYLTAPMVTLSQPWAVRRFVPMVLPLFSGLIVLACHLWFKACAEKFGVRVEKLIILAAAFIVALQMPQALFLWDQPLYAGVEAKVKAMADDLPKGAIILLPDSEASSHLQSALQYSWGRSVLTMPLATPVDADFERHMIAYIQRQLQQGRQLVIIFKQTQLVFPSLAANFKLSFLRSWPISFSYIPQTGFDVFPGSINEINDEYYAFVVEQKESSAKSYEKLSVDIGNIKEDLQFIGSGVLGPEKEMVENGYSFRWTGGRAEFYLPSAVRQIDILINPWGQLGEDELGLTVEINGVKVGFKYQQEKKKNRLIIPVAADLVNGMKSYALTIGCNTFAMASLGLGDDSRELGLAVDELILQY